MRLWEHWDPAKASPDSLLSWRKEFLLEFAETDAGRRPPLGELPVIVVSSDPIATEPARQSRNRAAARLDFLTANSAHITATGSRAHRALYRPDLAARA